MNRTIYLTPEEDVYFRRAIELTGDHVSTLVAEYLKKWVHDVEAEKAESVDTRVRKNRKSARMLKKEDG